MSIIFELIFGIAVFSAVATYVGMKLVEWWECRK